MIRAGALLVTIAMAILLQACGGGGSSSSTSGSPAAASSTGELSKSEWIAQADEICQTYKDETSDLKSEFESLEESGLSSPKELVEGAALFREILPKSEEETEELRELDPPSGDESILDAMLSKVEEAQAVLLKVADALEEGEIAEVSSFVKEGEQANNTAKGMAQGYGLKVCGSEE
jgi:hypothetical protein